MIRTLAERRGELPSRPTPRELQVIKLIAQGKCSKEIADELGVSLSTVVTHRANIYQRMGFPNIVELVLYAVRNGIVQVSPSSTTDQTFTET
jgi:DNA-binding CsgD family transcriptional regulator